MGIFRKKSLQKNNLKRRKREGLWETLA